MPTQPSAPPRSTSSRTTSSPDAGRPCVGTTEAARPVAARWRRSPRRDFHWRDWGGDSVVFEQLSGHTYQLPPLNAAVMACFEEREHDLDDLASTLAGDLGVPVDAPLRAAVTACVEQLLKLGWIEPIGPE